MFKTSYSKNKVLWLVVFLCLAAYVLVSFSPMFFVKPDGDFIRITQDVADYRIYYERTDWLDRGELPYKDSPQEYPQLAVLYFTAVRYFSSDFHSFIVIFRFTSILLLVALIVLSSRMLKELGRSQKYLFLLLLPSLLFFAFGRFDVLPAFLIQAALYFSLKKRPFFAVLFFAIAFFVKWYAFFFLLVYLLYLFVNKKEYDRRQRVWSIAIPTIVFVAIMGVSCFWFGASGVIETYLFHFIRVSELGSLLSLMIIYTLFILQTTEPLNIVYLIYSYILKLFLFVGLGVAFIFRKKLTSYNKFLSATCFLLMVFLLTLNFSSPQWIIWFVPVFLLIINRPRDVWLLIFYDILNYLTFPVLADVGLEIIQVNVLFHIFSSIKVVIIIYFIITFYRELTSKVETTSSSLFKAFKGVFLCLVNNKKKHYEE